MGTGLAITVPHPVPSSLVDPGVSRPLQCIARAPMHHTIRQTLIHLGFSRILFILLSLLLVASTVHAHNGRLALGLPAEDIVVDGDLSDWPQDMPRYSVTMAKSGTPPENPQDFTADFRVAYSVEANLLYVAVEVEDESILLESPDAWWNNADGCDVVGHGNLGGGVAQLTLWGRNLNYRPDGVGDAYKVIARERPHGRVYEWAVDISRLGKDKTLQGHGLRLRRSRGRQG